MYILLPYLIWRFSSLINGTFGILKSVILRVSSIFTICIRVTCNNTCILEDVLAVNVIASMEGHRHGWSKLFCISEIMLSANIGLCTFINLCMTGKLSNLIIRYLLLRV